MESGQRKDAAGKIVPRKIINTFTAAFNGKTVFEADWHPAISANPYQSFFFKAPESGEFKFAWKDDDGSELHVRRTSWPSADGSRRSTAEAAALGSGCAEISHGSAGGLKRHRQARMKR